MHTTSIDKTNIIKKFSKHIELSNVSLQEWKIGIASLERVSRLEVQDEISYQCCDMDLAKEVLFHFIAQGVQTCKMSKPNSNGIYIYK